MVNIPNHIELSKFIAQDFCNNKSFSYNWNGVVNHFGNLGFGHYNWLINQIRKINGLVLMLEMLKIYKNFQLHIF